MSYVDYTKALGILFVLPMNSGMNFAEEYFLFAMPLFSIASGYTMNIKDKELKAFVKKQVF